MDNFRFFDEIRKYRIILKILVASLLLWYILGQIDIIQIYSVIRDADPLILGSAFLLAIINQLVISNIKWSIVLNAYNASIPFKRLCDMYLTGMFFNMFLPGAYGGDLVRAYQVSRHTESAVEGVMSVIVERMTGLMGLLLILLLSILLFDQPFMAHGLKAWIISGIMLFFSGFMLLFTRNLMNRLLQLLPSGNKIEIKIKEIYESIYTLKNKRLVVSMTFFSILFQFLVILTNYMIAISLDVNLPFTYFLLAIPIASLISMIPVTLNGIGVRDMSYIALFSAAGVSKEAAFSIGLIAFLMGVAMSIYGGFIYMRQK